MDTQCPLCKSKSVKPYYGDDQRILKCHSCGALFLSPDLVHKSAPYYEEGQNYTRVLHDKSRLAFIKSNARNILSFIVSFIDPRGKRLLDIGAHTGIFVREAIQVGFNAEGVELNSSAVRWAKDQNIPITQSDIFNFNPNHSFDVVSIFHVLEHLDDPVRALKKIRDMIVPDGYLAIEVPNSDSYLAKKEGLSWKFIALEHLHYFSEKTLTRLLEDNGFKICMRKKRNHELRKLNIKKLIRYFFGTSASRNRLEEKVVKSSQETYDEGQSLLKKMIKSILINAICLCGRQDHIFIIAQKVE